MSWLVSFPMVTGLRYGLWGLLVIGGVAVAPAQGAGNSAGGAEVVAAKEDGWPQFRGPRRDGISTERGLLAEWPADGPALLWSVSGAGRGFSSPVIAAGKIFVTGEFGAELRVLAFDLQGRPRWSVRNGDAWLNQYPGARATVAYSAGRVYHENAHGRVVCLDAETGQEVWAVDLLARFGGENITWGLSECLLVDDERVYATPGGKEALLVALDKRSGKVVWQSPPLHDAEENGAVESAGYVSPLLVRFAGRRLLLGCSLRHLYCADADTGKLQWTRRRPTSYAVLAMMPTLVGDAVFMTAPHGPPGRLYRLVAPATPQGDVGVEEAWSTRLDTCQGGVVHVAGRLYGSYYPARQGWAALAATTGEVLYEAPELVKGAAAYADGRLYALCEDGWMLLLEPTASRFEVKGRFRLPKVKGRDAWAHPVVWDGKLYLRYHDTLQCHDIRAGAGGA